MADNERGAFFDEFIEGGLLDDAEVVIRSARFSTWDYKGKITQPVLALRAEMVDAEGKVHEQFMSSGELKFFVPSSDGRKAVPVGQYQKLNKNTIAAAFIMSIMNADTRGEMTARLRSTDDISILDGLRVHVIRRKQPKRPNLVAPGSEAAAGAAQDDEKSQLVVDRVLAYPWEAGAGQAAAPQAQAQAAPAYVPPAYVPPPVQQAAPAPVAQSAPAGNGQAGVHDLAIGVLVSVVAAAGGNIQKAMIAGKVYTDASIAAQPPAVKNAVLGMIVRDDFLLSPAVQAVGVKYNQQAGVVSLG